MANKFHGYKQLTHRYNAGWKRDEEYEYAGLFHILSSSKPDYGDENSSWYGEAWHRKYRIKAPINLDFETIWNVLESEFRTSCRCEHDCCGHVSTYVIEIHHLKRREYLVTVGFSVNC